MDRGFLLSLAGDSGMAGLIWRTEEINILVVWAAITNYHRLGGFNNQYLVLTVLEAWKSKMKSPGDPVSDENLPPGL